jgi:hypothetical protein
LHSGKPPIADKDEATGSKSSQAHTTFNLRKHSIVVSSDRGHCLRWLRTAV